MIESSPPPAGACCLLIFSVLPSFRVPLDPREPPRLPGKTESNVLLEHTLGCQFYVAGDSLLSGLARDRAATPMFSL